MADVDTEIGEEVGEEETDLVTVLVTTAEGLLLEQLGYLGQACDHAKDRGKLHWPADILLA